MPLTPKGQIDRTGSVSFGDASISVWEEGIAEARNKGGHKGEEQWERSFKCQVFDRVVQTLNRLGWTVTMPDIKAYDVKHYGGTVARWAAERRRECTKGGLAGELTVQGRVVELKMWQTVLPHENPNGPQYDFEKQKRMPYVVRLEMERTRRRIRDYLCNVFTEYLFEERTPNVKPASMPALEWIASRWAENEHANPDEWEDAARRDVEIDPYNRKSGDGLKLEHGQRVYTTNYHGRWLVGHAYKDGGMWDVVVSHLSYERKSANELYVNRPPDLRSKHNQRQRRKRLEQEMQKAVKAMNFKRAELLKTILFPSNETLYLIKTKGDSRSKGAYFAPDYCGYRNSPVDAGKYTRAELKPYFGDKLETAELVAVPVA